MRIGLLINLAPRKLGSLERWLVEMAREVRGRGHELDIFARRPIHPQVEADLAALRVGFSTTDELEKAPSRAVRLLSTYDLLHLNMFQPRMKPALLCYAAWPAKVVLVDHTSGYPEPATSTVKRLLRSGLDRVSLIRVDQLVGVSNYVTRRDLVRFAVPDEKAKTIYNGVDVPRFVARRRPTGGYLRIAVVAHLIPEKGVDVLLRALPQMKDQAWECVIVGDGHKGEEFKALSRSLGLEKKVQFLGLRDDVPDILQDCDVLVHPAVWQEAFGLTITEGMASGCAVIATRTGGIPEIIDDRKTGLLVPPNDSVALANALDELAKARPLVNELGQAARRAVEERFSMVRCVSEHVDQIELVAGLEPRKTFEIRTPAQRQQVAAPAGGKNEIASGWNPFTGEAAPGTNSDQPTRSASVFTARDPSTEESHGSEQAETRPRVGQ